VEYLIKQYPLESGALEIQYIEEYFGEFPRRKTAAEIIDRLSDRESLILMAEAPLPDDPGTLVPVSYKVVHEVYQGEAVAKLRDLVERLHDHVRFDGRRILYSWIGATRRDWRGQGFFRALTEESEAWAVSHGFHEVVVKTKNSYYDMRSVLTQLQFDVIKYERNASDNTESKVYLSKLLTAEMVAGHRSVRAVTHVE
jgi:GNAT superfamily N-acetyltransferase